MPGLADLVDERGIWRREQRRVVFTNGCFDILHAGHIALLEAARAEGDLLIVGLNDDASVGRLKGPGRPVLPEQERSETLLALEAVDRVLLYTEPTPLRCIEALLPDVLVKGADWDYHAIVGREAVEDAGGRVVRVALLPGRSSTATVARIRGS